MAEGKGGAKGEGGLQGLGGLKESRVFRVAFTGMRESLGWVFVSHYTDN